MPDPTVKHTRMQLDEYHFSAYYHLLWGIQLDQRLIRELSKLRRCGCAVSEAVASLLRAEAEAAWHEAYFPSEKRIRHLQEDPSSDGLIVTLVDGTRRVVER
ncbi:MAG: hypothetical protein HYZ75_00860 [Elusimicrobia bacterium]|nr:hypothetical protein [Elusimicrobiota bacterium]